MNDDERRLEPRYEIAVPIDVEGVRGMTRNLSMNGVIFISPISFEIGRMIDFGVFIRAGSCRLLCRGRVVRHRQLPDRTFDVAASIDSFTMQFENAARTAAPSPTS